MTGPDIASSLAELRTAGAAAGFQPDEIDREAAAFAAGIGAGTGASDAWAQAFGRPASEFAAAARAGRRGRTAPPTC